MTERQQEIAEALMRLLFVQGGDCRASDYVVDDVTVADLLEEYERQAAGGRNPTHWSCGKETNGQA